MYVYMKNLCFNAKKVYKIRHEERAAGFQLFLKVFSRKNFCMNVAIPIKHLLLPAILCTQVHVSPKNCFEVEQQWREKESCCC